MLNRMKLWGVLKQNLISLDLKPFFKQIVRSCVCVCLRVCVINLVGHHLSGY